mgnify:CR=1 FL=1
MDSFMASYIGMTELLGFIAFVLVLAVFIMDRGLRNIQETQVKTNILLDKIGKKTTKEE